MILDMVIVWLDTLSQEAKKDVQMCLIVQNMQSREIWFVNWSEIRDVFGSLN